MSSEAYTSEFESSNWSSMHKESDEALIDDGSLNEEADDPEIEAIKARVKEMEEEAEKLKEMQKEAESSLMSPQHADTIGSDGEAEEASRARVRSAWAKFRELSPLLTARVPSSLPGEDQASIDCRSVYVGNVDYSATASELEQHFHGCGSVNRVTILCDKFSGHPKGFAYVEFGDKDSVDNAVQLSDSLFKGRQIKVTAKRTNVPGISTTNRGFRGGQARGRGRGGFRGGYMGGFTPRGRGAYRSRRAQWFSPY